MIFAKVQFENNNSNIFVKKFKQLIIVINLIAIALFFKTTCINIFNYLLTAGSTKKKLLRLVSIYHKTIETNSQGILYLHCLI